MCLLYTIAFQQHQRWEDDQTQGYGTILYQNTFENDAVQISNEKGKYEIIVTAYDQAYDDVPQAEKKDHVTKKRTWV